MSNVLRLAIVDPNEASRESLKSTLLSMDSVWLEAECSRYEFFCDVVEQTEPDVAIIAMDENPEKALELVGSVRGRAPNCGVLVISSSTDGSLILRAMRAGVSEFLPQPIQIEDLFAALDRAGQKRYGDGETSIRASNIIAVAGATGGVGTTSIAVNLGCALAADEKNTVVLVDLDLCLGDADVFLDAIPDYTLADVAQNISRLDFGLLKRSLTKHTSGLYLLPRPVQLEDNKFIEPEDLTRVIGLLKATFTHVIIDLSKSFGPLDMVAMETATMILLASQLDLPCLRNVVRLMMSFGEMEGIREKVRILVNRVGKDDGQISLKKAEETIGAPIYWQLLNDYRVMVEVRNNGVPLIEHAPRAAITQQIAALAATLSGKEPGPEETKAGNTRRWLSLWGKKD